jgi:NAD(P)-dependent dehydrogenase (short-subunit alcohol dehydrogenase family)
MLLPSFYLVSLLLSIMSSVGAALRPACLVTGSTDGIGLTTAKNMAAKGYDVFIHGRDAERIQRAKETVRSFVRAQTNNEPRIVALVPSDLSTIQGSTKLAKSVVDACEEHSLNLSVVMNNAGVYAQDRILTDDGIELTFAVNVVAPFIITSYLLPTLLKQKHSRIVIASSISQCSTIRAWDDLTFKTRPYNAGTSYAESKLFDAMLTFEMAEKLKAAKLLPPKITCNCLDPGTVNTKMLLAGWGPCGIHVDDAKDETWLCSSESVTQDTGRYYVSQSDRTASRSAYDERERAKLWSVLSGLSPEAAAIWDTL